jgi:putative ABC transport system permease protein
MKLLRRFWAVLRREKVDAEMSEEMHLHLEQRIQEHVATGMSPEDARYAAMRRFGHVEGFKEHARDGRAFRSLERLGQDVRFAVRMLRKSPGFTTVAVLTLALGIGINTAMFSVVYGVLLDPYPYAKSDEIWAPQLVEAKTGRGWYNFRATDAEVIAKLAGVSAAMATNVDGAMLRHQNSTELLTAPRLTASAFEFLGVAPVLGRTFNAADYRENGEPQAVTVLSFKLWQRLFQGERGAVGQTVIVNDMPHVVLGVMPPRFGWYTNDGLWLPMPTTQGQLRVNPIVRLKSGVTKTVVEQQLLSAIQEVAKAAPERFPKDGFTARLNNYLDVSVSSGEMRSSLHLLFYAVGFLLLIACTNVANLQLARAASRGREIAVRLAIGASRGRLMQQLLTESMVLALVGGVLGVGLAFALTQIIVSLMPPFYVPNEARVTMNGWVLGFSVAVSLITGVLFGLAPGLETTRPDLTEGLKDGGHAAGMGSARGARTRSALVVAEVALSVVLLVGAFLAIRGFAELQRVDRGFRAENALIVRVPLVPKRYHTVEMRNSFARDFLGRIATLPGVASATIGMLPGMEGGSGVSIPGQPKPTDGVGLNFASVDYIQTWGLVLRAGRNFTAHEIANGERVALITEATAKFWLNGENPIGRTMEVDTLASGTVPNNIAPVGASKTVTIIGILADTRARNLRAEPPAVVVVPYTLRGQSNRVFAVRGHGESAVLLNSIRAELRAMDPEQPLSRAMTIEEIIGQQTVQPRFNMALFSALAVIALLLAAAGIYGVLSYQVAQRTREIGVRVALGASRSNIMRLVVGSGARLVGLGLLLGAAASVALGKILTTQVFAVPLIDPIALIAAALLLALAGLVACFIPGQRATRVDPMVALRSE